MARTRGSINKTPLDRLIDEYTAMDAETRAMARGAMIVLDRRRPAKLDAAQEQEVLALGASITEDSNA